MNASGRHWPEYTMEAACLGAFMLLACVFVTLLEHPGSRLHPAIADPTLRRVLVGLAMGATAIALIYSPWGQQSGAHMNPSLVVTMAVAIRTALWDQVDGISSLVGLTELAYVALLVWLGTHGPGPLSLDWLLGRGGRRVAVGRVAVAAPSRAAS